MSDETTGAPTTAPSCTSDHPHPTKEQARRNVEDFLAELRLGSPQVRIWDQAPGYHLDLGEFGFRLERGSRRIQVGMTGVPRPREGVDPWYFPRMSIDGNTYFWDVGLDAARRLLADPDQSDQERVKASQDRCQAELGRQPRCADCGSVRVPWQEPPLTGPEGPRPGEYQVRCLCCDWVVKVRRESPGGGTVYGDEGWRGREHDLVHLRRLPPEGLGLPCPWAECRRQRWHRGNCRPWWEVVDRARVPGDEEGEAPAPGHDEMTAKLSQVTTQAVATAERSQDRLNRDEAREGPVAQLTRERDEAREALRAHRDVWRQEGSHETHAARRRDLAAALGRDEDADWVAMIDHVTQLATERDSPPTRDLDPRLGTDRDVEPRRAFFRKFREAHEALHRRWAINVGRPGYDKGDWRTLDNFLSELGREYAASLGIPRDRPLLVPEARTESGVTASSSDPTSTATRREEGHDSELARPLTAAEAMVWAIAFDRALASNVGADAAARAAYHAVVVLRTSCDRTRLSAGARAVLDQVTGGRR